jgi:hypothetical protein
VSEGSSEQPGGDVTRRRRVAGAVPTGLADASPTWELELLLSGAVLVALFQVSGVFDRTFDRLEPHATRAAAIPLFFAYLYGKAMVLALIGTFVLHLASRGYWVGLVGLNSVFPNGVRWDQLKYGPVTRELIRERLSSLPPIIARLDNFCSALFSFGFLLVLAFAISLLMAAVAGGLAYLVSLAFFDGRRTLTVFYVVLALLALIPLATTLADRRFGARLDPASPRGRALRRAALGYYWSMGLPVYGPIMLTLLSNTRRRAFVTVLYTAMFGLLVLVTARFIAGRGGLGVNGYAYFAQPDQLSVNAAYYESLRSAGEPLPRTPTIQSDVIREPYVKLFIPYWPERHNRAIATRCPGVRPLRPLGFKRPNLAEDPVPDSAAAAVLHCFGVLHPVTLNGALLAGLEFRFHTHPRNSLRGVVAYIPTAGLPRGRNLLTIEQVPRVARGGRPPRPVPAAVIPFWW